jgi:hypothetical protein
MMLSLWCWKYYPSFSVFVWSAFLTGEKSYRLVLWRLLNSCWKLRVVVLIMEWFSFLKGCCRLSPRVRSPLHLRLDLIQLLCRQTEEPTLCKMKASLGNRERIRLNLLVLIHRMSTHKVPHLKISQLIWISTLTATRLIWPCSSMSQL